MDFSMEKRLRVSSKLFFINIFFCDRFVAGWWTNIEKLIQSASRYYSANMLNIRNKMKFVGMKNEILSLNWNGFKHQYTIALSRKIQIYEILVSQCLCLNCSQTVRPILMIFCLCMSCSSENLTSIFHIPTFSWFWTSIFSSN